MPDDQHEQTATPRQYRCPVCDSPYRFGPLVEHLMDVHNWTESDIELLSVEGLEVSVP